MKDNSNVVIKLSFLDKKHESWSWYTNNKTSDHKDKVNASKASLKPISHIDYVGRKTACELEVKSTPGSYAAYMNGDHNIKKVQSEGHFYREGSYTNKEWGEAQKLDRWTISKKSLVWTPVISFRQDYQEMFQMVSKEDAAWIIRETIDDFFRANKIEPESMEYLGQFHVDRPHHFHIHLRVHQKTPGCHDWKTGRDKFRTKGKFSQASIENWKVNIDSALVRRMMRFKDINSTRNDLKYKVLASFDDPKIIGEVIELASKIKSKIPIGRFQYDGIKNIVTKTQVDLLVDKLINCKEESRDQFDKMHKLIDDQIDKKIKEASKLTDHGKIVETLNKVRDDKKLEIWKHLANQALKQIKNGRYDKYQYSGHQKPKVFGQIKARNKIFDQFTSKKFWGSLESSIRNEIQDIQALLEKNIKDVQRESE